MLTEFDQSTIANMTAALDYVCKKIPAEHDGNALRKQIADELIKCARTGRRTVIDFQQAGIGVVKRSDKTAKAPLVWLVAEMKGAWRY